MEGPTPRHDEPTPGMRVLVVDDNHDTARMMRLLLKAQGYDVKVAFNGQQALDAAESFQPSVVLLDLTLPDMDGTEVAEQLRTTECFRQTAFVAVSGFSSEQIPAIFDRHFQKPVDHDGLNAYLAERAAKPTPSQAGEALLPASTSDIESGVPQSIRRS